MIEKEVIIKNKSGLDSKPAALFIQKASNFKSAIWIENNERKANAKSLLGLLSLGVSSGTKVVLSADGDDELRAIDELVLYLAQDIKESV
jgi:phosphocarrier protein HPr